jgi:hypothetical protein
MMFGFGFGIVRKDNADEVNGIETQKPRNPETQKPSNRITLTI